MTDHPQIPENQDEFRRLVASLVILLIACMAMVWVTARTALYAYRPDLRPRDDRPVGNVETCDHDCALRRVRELENKLEGKR